MPAVQKEKKQKAIELRLKGKSYGEILKILNIPSKGTLSVWLKDIPLTPEAKKRLENNMRVAYTRGLFSFNKKRTKNIIIENQMVFSNATKAINKISKNELLLVGTALYWGEGTTREKSRGYQRISFSNSDPDMVKIFMRYLREILEVSDEKMRPYVHIHKNIKPNIAIKFWSEIAELPKKSFYTYDAVSKSGKFKHPANFLPYGTFNIRATDRRLFYTIKGYINGLVKQIA